MKTNTRLWSCLALFFLEWEIFRQRLHRKNTHFMFNNFFFKSFSLWDGMDKQGAAGQATDDNIIWHMHFASWITKAKNIHPEYVTIVTFALKQWFNECASVLHYMYIACDNSYLFTVCRSISHIQCYLICAVKLLLYSLIILIVYVSNNRSILCCFSDLLNLCPYVGNEHIKGNCGAGI
jgi:hypothetical protein